MKIIVTSKWSIGMVSHLVIWYSIIVTIVLFFITPIKEENLWQNKFLILQELIFTYLLKSNSL
nr:hypothetical protein [Clostridium kluyveri]